MRAYAVKEKITGSLHLRVEEQWSYKTARAHLDNERILAEENFHLVWWKGLCETRKDFPKIYWTWLTKQVSEFSGTNRQLAYWNTEVGPQCPSCGEVEEHMIPMTRCRHPGWEKMLRLTILTLTN